MTDKSSPELLFRSIDENLKEIRENIQSAAERSGRSAKDVRLMAVSKTVEPLFINRALAQGVDLIGENKVQELLGKLDFLQPANVEKHLIGHLQSNKVRKIADVVTCIQSVDSVSLAEEISRQMSVRGRSMDILLEVNIGDEDSKTGLPAAALMETAQRIEEMDGIRIRGLMAIPPICKSDVEVRSYFAKARRLYEDMKTALPATEKIDTFSIGMSGDYVPAILEGATLVRIGSAMFGARRY